MSYYLENWTNLTTFWKKQQKKKKKKHSPVNQGWRIDWINIKNKKKGFNWLNNICYTEQLFTNGTDQ